MREETEEIEMLEEVGAADIFNAFNTDGSRVDPYAALAAIRFRVRYEEVTDRQRKAAKYFGIYGGSFRAG